MTNPNHAFPSNQNEQTTWSKVELHALIKNEVEAQTRRIRATNSNPWPGTVIAALFLGTVIGIVYIIWGG